MFATPITSVPLAACHDAYSRANITPRLEWIYEEESIPRRRLHLEISCAWKCL